MMISSLNFAKIHQLPSTKARQSWAALNIRQVYPNRKKRGDIHLAIFVVLLQFLKRNCLVKIAQAPQLLQRHALAIATAHLIRLTFLMYANIRHLFETIPRSRESTTRGTLKRPKMHGCCRKLVPKSKKLATRNCEKSFFAIWRSLSFSLVYPLSG